MHSDFSKNEIFMSCEYIKSHNLFLKKGSVVNVIGKHCLCDYICSTLKSLNDTTEYGYTVYQSENADALSSTVKKQCFLYCFDARTNDTYKLTDMTKALEYASKTEDAQFIALVIVPPLSKREDVKALSEIELSKISRNTFLEKIEDALSLYKDKLNVKEIRFDNFLMEDSIDNALNFSAIINDAVSTKCVTADSGDAFDVISAVTFSDAINAVFTVAVNGNHGNIYNCSGEALSLFEVKSFVYETLCKYGIRLNFINSENQNKKSYRVLNCGKLNSLGFTRVCDSKTAMLYALDGILPDTYDVISDKLDSIYDGKISYIREQELELLKVVDKICSENSITYFLSGGTMLGAARHKGFIPWDDDIDIAMLREDYERFKKACIEQLPQKYEYQSYTNKDGYHYFFDKITIKDTYFSTKYSDKFDMRKGIFMDIFVFDKTSDKPFFQKLHFNTLMKMRLLMNVRWINCARKDKSYMLSKLLLPILRIFSMDTYSKWYDKVLRRYEKRKTSTVLPPATDHKWRGVMPKKWFDDVTITQFENVPTYIPVGCDNYLKQWYGDDFMEMLPLCKRVGSHDFYRLDIGNEINSVDESDVKHYNYKGELL